MKRFRWGCVYTHTMSFVLKLNADSVTLLTIPLPGDGNFGFIKVMTFSYSHQDQLQRMCGAEGRIQAWRSLLRLG